MNIPTPTIISDKQAGFTLVELMVSLSLFIIVVLALIGSLYSVNDASRKVQAMRIVMDNLNFAMESMSRTIRTGEGIVCGGEFDRVGNPNCPISSATMRASEKLSVRSTLGENRIVEYRWVRQQNGNYSIEKRSVGINAKDRTPDFTDVRPWTAITAPEINIEKFAFYVDGAASGDGQPNVIIKLEGVATVVDGTTVPFAMQTYLSQRTPEQRP